MTTGKFVRTLLVTAALLLMASLSDVRLAAAQEPDTEPNQPCTQAQNLGAIPLPFTLFGSLDATPTAGDVDFFRFVGTPGALVRIDLEGLVTSKGTLQDPFLGVFDSSCNLIMSNDDFQGLNSRISAMIPADGVLILAATSCCDGGFNGAFMNGTYQLTVSTLSAIRSISGRTVDAVTKQPLPGTASPPFAQVRLLRCEAGICSDVASQSVGTDGRFQFNRDMFGQFLSAGSYEIIASAQEYQDEQTDPIQVSDGEDRDLGDIALEPFPARFSDITPCSDVPAAGGRCRYSVRITNRLGTRLTGAAWSVVDAFGTGSLADVTRFQANGTHKLGIDPQESKVMHFSFEVPGTVRAGAFICAQVLFADDRREPFFNTVAVASLFCITKTAETSPALSVVPRKDAERMNRGSGGRMMTPPKAKSH
jgi:hypothetical protein